MKAAVRGSFENVTSEDLLELLAVTAPSWSPGQRLFVRVDSMEDYLALGTAMEIPDRDLLGNRKVAISAPIKVARKIRAHHRAVIAARDLREQLEGINAS